MKPIEAIMRTAPVIPVIVIDDVADAVSLAQALVAGVAIGDVGEGEGAAERSVAPGGDAVVAQEATLARQAGAGSLSALPHQALMAAS